MRKTQEKQPSRRVTLEDIRDFYRKEFGDYLNVQDYTNEGGAWHSIKNEVIVPIQSVVPFHITSPSTFLREYLASEERKKDEKRFGKILFHFKGLGFTEILNAGAHGDDALHISGWHDYSRELTIYSARFERDKLERNLIGDEKPNCVCASAGRISEQAGLSIVSDHRDAGLYEGRCKGKTPEMLETLADALRFKEVMNKFCQKNNIRNHIERESGGADMFLFTLDLSERGIRKLEEVLEERYPSFLDKQKSEGLLRQNGNLAGCFSKPDYNLRIGHYFEERGLFVPQGMDMIAKFLSTLYNTRREGGF